MSFCTDAWDASAEIRSRIAAHPFVRGLGDGSLERARFEYYMAQDALYLAAYARALAALAVGADDADEIVFWSAAARDAIVAERELHAHHVAQLDVGTMAPTCQAYTSYLLALPATAGHAVAAAGVLPCFWIYADVGRHLLDAAGDLSAHPFGDWIAMYADEAFAESVAQAKAICDRLAERCDAAGRQQMIDAFVAAARYEWMFWDAAWRSETWPV